ncbi:hypothetical protein NLJ89_g7015 [Agrocybe chaxingu]|uniref:Uncharacterized protein n=1 Tax=Agrocybe chaxingu TaxID=84603 RepID=A0A9W8MS52_9AGAR|nr:hypothetical protein NLJ89_g7015 [Agrocybe chaxingu]
MTKTNTKKSKQPSAEGTKPQKPSGSARAPNIEWVKNPDWTWALIAYLTDHVIFRTKLFSDSTADAAREGRNKAVTKDGKSQQYGVLAKHIFEDEPSQAKAYKQDPIRFATSVETRLRRLKNEYSTHLKTLGATGAGLAPEDVTPGSTMAGLRTRSLHESYRNALKDKKNPLHAVAMAREAEKAKWENALKDPKSPDHAAALARKAAAAEFRKALADPKNPKHAEALAKQQSLGIANPFRANLML